MKMTTGIPKDQQNLDKPSDKQMGCMASFLQIFYRHNKKLHTTKRLTASAAPAARPSGSDNPATPSESHHVPKELEIPKTIKSPLVDLKLPPSPQPKTVVQPLPVFELKEGAKSSRKFKETHRLSLDSRAAYDTKGSLHRKDINEGDKDKPRSSTSVIAKLMGFEPIQQIHPPESAMLKRSASESRITRDLFHHRFIDAPNNQIEMAEPKTQISVPGPKSADPIGKVKSEAKCTSSWRLAQHRKSFFETAEVFPEPTPKQRVGEKDRRLIIKGIDEASNDLETLKQILEVWQLKGLLHSNRQQFSHRNIVYDHSSLSTVSQQGSQRNVKLSGERLSSVSPRRERNVKVSGERASSVSPRRERNVKSPTRTRGFTSPTRSENNATRGNSVVNPKPLSVETSQRVNQSTEKRRFNSPPPRVSPKRSGSGPVNRNGKKSSEKDETCSSSTPFEKSKMEEYKDGRSLLERCGKLLNSIAEMNGRDQQSSPVSVLDSSFYESESPSPIMKRSIDFRGVSGELLEEDTWSQLTFTSRSKSEDSVGSENYDDLAYISDILRSSHYLPEDSDIFLLLEKQRCFKRKDTSQVSLLHRKLIFDIINEILERNRKLPALSSWKVCVPKGSSSSLQQVWSEFLKIREHEYYGDDLVEVICGVLRKDLNNSDAINGWGECRVELSEVVLAIERMIFRDLVGETIHDVATLASKSTGLVAHRRKLSFLS